MTTIMTVKKMIEKLESFDENAWVYCHCIDDDFSGGNKQPIFEVHDVMESHGEMSTDEKDGKPRIKYGSKSDKTRPLAIIEITNLDNC